MSDKPRCTATTKAGEPCPANPVFGSGLCLAHSPADVRQSLGFVPDNGKAGRKPMPKPSDIARNLIEQNVLAVQRPYWRTLGYDVEIGPDGPQLVELTAGGAKLYATSQKDGVVVVSEYDDLEAMQRAAERLQDRVYGKPKQVSEVSGPEGGPVQLSAPLDERARSAHAAGLLRDLGEVEPDAGR